MQGSSLALYKTHTPEELGDNSYPNVQLKTFKRAGLGGGGLEGGGGDKEETSQPYHIPGV